MIDDERSSVGSETGARSSISGSETDASVSISVVVRVRPLTPAERKAGYKSTWEQQGGSIWQGSPGLLQRAVVPTQVYSFDHVFGANESTSDIHRAVAESRVARLLQGYNATVFAYGQTSSGKTSTVRGMEGQEGLITLCMRQVIEGVAAQRTLASGREVRWGMRISYLEIYNEAINDLLTGQTNLNVYEKKGGGNMIQDLHEETVTDLRGVEGVLRVGDGNRHIGATAHNEASSRAHTVFRLLLECCAADGGQIIFTSELNLVDLAGSERASAHARGPAGAVGVRGKDARQTEGGHINKSLLILSTVIHKLSEVYSSISLYLSISIYISISTSIHMSMSISISICKDIYGCLSLYLALDLSRSLSHTHAHTHIHVCANIHTPTDSHKSTRTQTFMCVRVYACVRACVCVWHSAQAATAGHVPFEMYSTTDFLGSNPIESEERVKIWIGTNSRLPRPSTVGSLVLA